MPAGRLETLGLIDWGPMSRRRHIRVTGRVQGVAYRASCVQCAGALGLSGWVRNRVDGSVEIEAEGEPGALAQLLEWCATGPPGAAVSAVTSEERVPLGGSGFTIHPTA